MPFSEVCGWRKEDGDSTDRFKIGVWTLAGIERVDGCINLPHLRGFGGCLNHHEDPEGCRGETKTDKGIQSLQAQRAEYIQGKTAIQQERGQAEQAQTPQERVEKSVQERQQALQEQEKLHWWNFIKKHKRKKELKQYKEDLERLQYLRQNNAITEQEFEEEKKHLRFKYILITIILVVIAIVFSSEFTIQYYFKNSILNKNEAVGNAEENIDEIGKTLKNFRKLIDNQFIGEIDEQKILDETIKGYIKGLDDEYSEYMTTEEWEEFQSLTMGNYVGIGIYMGVDKNNNIVVLAPIEQSPAERVGIKTGDIIVEVDGENALGVSSDIVSSKIKGEEGTTVKLKIARENEYLDFEIPREAIKMYHVKSEMKENNIGYVSLLTFDENCADEIRKSFEDLKSKGAKKIILDLRNNTGGLVDEALEIADMIIPKDQTLLITVDSAGNKEYSKAEQDPIIDCDIVVLANEYSASASEILIGALRDAGKAKVVGTKTYGKGVIQSVYLLNDNSALKLTVNEYYTPNETKINKVGIEPDYVVELDENSEEDAQLNKALEILK